MLCIYLYLSFLELVSLKENVFNVEIGIFLYTFVSKFHSVNIENALLTRGEGI